MAYTGCLPLFSHYAAILKISFSYFLLMLLLLCMVPILVDLFFPLERYLTVNSENSKSFPPSVFPIKWPTASRGGRLRSGQEVKLPNPSLSDIEKKFLSKKVFFSLKKCETFFTCLEKVMPIARPRPREAPVTRTKHRPPHHIFCAVIFFVTEMNQSEKKLRTLHCG